MENKYYTPDISEFHVGFEFESFVDRFKEWRFNKVGKYELNAIAANINYNFENYYRVKYLDKEDIESFGFTQVTNGYPTGFENEKYWINFREIDGLPNLCIYEKLGRFRLFSGTIKNKSELKVLFKQLNIIK